MDKRERLLTAAIDCLARFGWARTTTREIVASAGAHLPDVNYYFGSKGRLMHEAAVHAARRWAQGPLADAAEVASDAPAERLTEVLARFLATLESDRSDAVAAVEAFAQAERSEPLRAELGTAYEEFRVAVGDSVAGAAGRPAALETRALASVLIALFDGLALQSLLDPGGMPPADELVRALALVAASTAEPDS